MELLDKLSKTITDGSEKVVKKAKEVSNIASLKASIEKAKYTNDRIYSKIGKELFESHKEEILAKYPEDGATLVENLANIDKWTEEILNNKNAKTCPVCQKEVDKEEIYCHFCGAKFPETVVSEDQAECNCEENQECCETSTTDFEDDNSSRDNCF